ncbi:MAG: hypothetical protein P857_689 [Candidatus Xenolissoclinum pacificiensis L6]|uniref:Uncharacterized protein n=1 Tax=Candidatus Xenolissoclinum pacificiensis L6 TaxID=1401685 RepID=W2UZ41_9RICK|nr:MAG: hypothetical protein P857_689 [Candidatus Xenolissoclinum pacificiensis L6]
MKPVLNRIDGSYDLKRRIYNIKLLNLHHILVQKIMVDIQTSDKRLQ